MLGHKFDYSLKVVVVGDSGVGKTCMLLRFVRDQWQGETQPTLGVEFLTKVVQTEEHRIQLQLWDTAGQELFRSVTRGYYRGSAGALILFDLTSHDSFNNVQQWLDDLKEVARQDVVVVLIGNKSDMADKRDVTREEAENFAKSHSMPYFETSAKTGENVFDAVNQCVKLIEKKVDSGAFNFSQNQEPVKFKPEEKKSEGCSC